MRVGRALIGSLAMAAVLGTVIADAPQAASAVATPFSTLDDAVRAGMLDADVAAAVRAGRSAPVVVTFDSSAGPTEVDAAPLEGVAPNDQDPVVLVPPDPDRLRRAQRDIAAVESASFDVTRSYENLPLVAATVSSESALLGLLNRGSTGAVQADRRYRRSLSQSLSLIRQPEVVAQGWTGAGVIVGVIDSGLDWTNAAFGTCPQLGAPGCRVIELMPDFAAPDGVRDDDFHGTTVAAVIAGVAPDARLIGADVFDDDGAPISAVAAAVDAFISRKRAGLNIRAINLSLGASESYWNTPCPDLVGLTTAASWGITPVVASGNDRHVRYLERIGVTDPACVRAAVAVGGVYDQSFGSIVWGGNPADCADTNIFPAKTMCISQSGELLAVLAPGALITAGGRTEGGTSFAAPHVAGAVAVIAQAQPGISPSLVKDALRRVGQGGYDSRSGARILTLPSLLDAVREPSNDSRASARTIALRDGAVERIRDYLLRSTTEATDGMPLGSFGSLWYRLSVDAASFVHVHECVGQLFFDTEMSPTTHRAEQNDGADSPRMPSVWTTPPVCPGRSRLSTMYRVTPDQPITVVAAGSNTAAPSVWSSRQLWLEASSQRLSPVNDNRSGATSSPNGSDLAGATLEPGEVLAFDAAGPTVWFRSFEGQQVTVRLANVCEVHSCVPGSPSPGPTPTGLWASAWAGSALVGHARVPAGGVAVLGPFDLTVDIQIGADVANALVATGFDRVSSSPPTEDEPGSATSVGPAWAVPTAFATAQPGEVVGGQASVRSVWGTWVAPSGGSFVVRTIGSNFPTRLSVWRGTTNVGPASCDGAPLGGVVWAQCVLSVSAGERLLIGIDGVGAAQGTARVDVRPLAPAPRGPTPIAAAGGTTVPRRAPGGSTGSSSGGRTPAPQTPAPVA